MNLIICSRNCRYQREGYCSLEQPLPVSPEHSNGGCCYFERIEKSFH